jgi:hypothetical protein
MGSLKGALKMQINWFVVVPLVYVIGVVVTENSRIAAGLSRWDNPNGESLLWPLDVVIFAFASIYWLLIAPGRFFLWLNSVEEEAKPRNPDAVQHWEYLPDAAKLLGMSERSLRRRIKSGSIESKIICGRRHVRVS